MTQTYLSRKATSALFASRAASAVQATSFKRINRKLACFQIGVENRDYHHLSQNATIPGLVVRRGFINIYPDQTVAAHLRNPVSDFATYQQLALSMRNWTKRAPMVAFPSPKWPPDPPTPNFLEGPRVAAFDTSKESCE